jgi:RNA polymerase sigma-70 factor (ECF subfamily)
VAIWRSLATFDHRCSLRTWVYRVAHNTGASHVTRRVRFRRHQFVTLDELEAAAADPAQSRDSLDHHLNVIRLRELIQQLTPLDRQIMICYLEGMDAEAIGELVGMSDGAVAMKVHRVKRLLTKRFHGETNGL